MVAHIVRLKLRLLANSLRRSPAQIVGIVIGGLYGLFFLSVVIVALIAARSASVDAVQFALTLGGSALVLGWLIFPIVLSGIDSTLDPERFATFPIPSKSLLLGLTISGAIGIPGIVTVLISLGSIVSYSRSVPAVLAASFGALAAILLCLIGARAFSTLLGSAGRSRKMKDVANIVVMVLAVSVGPAIALLSRSASFSWRSLSDVAAVLQFTPLGAPWSMGADALRGDFLAVILKGLVCVLSVSLLLWMWNAGLSRSLTNVKQVGSRATSKSSLGLFRLLPATPTGSVAARVLTYFVRDPRYVGALLIVPIVGVMTIALYYVNGSEISALSSGILVASLMAWSVGSDVSFDSTAFALHVSTGVSGQADRWGRTWAYLLVSVPPGLIFEVIAVAVTGAWYLLPALVGLILGVAGGALGLGAIVSALIVFNVPGPGESPYKSRPGNNFYNAVRQLALFASMAVLAVPPLVLAVMAHTQHSLTMSIIALATGLVWGAVLMVGGCAWGAKLFDTSSVRIQRLLVAQAGA